MSPGGGGLPCFETPTAAGEGTVLFRGEAAVTVEFDGNPLDLDFRYLAVWVKHGGGWRFEAWQSTSTG